MLVHLTVHCFGLPIAQGSQSYKVLGCRGTDIVCNCPSERIRQTDQLSGLIFLRFGLHCLQVINLCSVSRSVYCDAGNRQCVLAMRLAFYGLGKRLTLETISGFPLLRGLDWKFAALRPFLTFTECCTVWRVCA